MSIVTINDFEEKMLVVGYIKNVNRKKRNLLSVKSIFGSWISNWPDDFRIGEEDKCPKIYNEQLVVSKGKYKKGIESPGKFEEYTDFLDYIRDFLNSNYNSGKSTRENAKVYAKLLTGYREKRTEEIQQLLRESGMYDLGYRIKIKDNENYTKLAKVHLYVIVDDKIRSIMADTFDTVNSYILQEIMFFTRSRKGEILIDI